MPIKNRKITESGDKVPTAGFVLLKSGRASEVNYIYNVCIYMLFTGCEVCTEKYFPEVSEAAPGRRPRDASEAEGKYFLVRTDLNGK